MKIQITPKDTKNIRKKSILQQTAFWSEVKRKQGIASQAFDLKTSAADLNSPPTEHHHVTDDLLILFQKIGAGECIGYVPYGPTMKPSPENQGLFLEELSESLRPYLPGNCIVLRYDLLWESPWARDDSYFDTRGHWMGPPAKVTQELRLNFETTKWNLKKSNTNILPVDTVFIDLRKDENKLLHEMKAKTRYNVKLSRRRGVRVRQGGLRDLHIWYRLYRETCRRNRLFLHDINFFRTPLTTGTRDIRSPAAVELIIAEIDNKPLAAIFCVFSGRMATYLYGSSSSRHRNYMAPYALQWEALKRAKKRGCAIYDMFGVAPQPDPSHPLYGLYRFKTGFGGKLFHRMGCWDYPLHRAGYDMYLATEMKSTGYHLQ